MNVFTILSGLVLLITVFYVGKNSNVDVPLINETNILQIAGVSFVIFLLGSFYDFYRRDVEVLCSNIPRKQEKS